MGNLSLYKLFAIKVNGKKVGTISAFFDNDIQNSICLKSFEVYPEYQNKGYGGSALRQVLDILKPKFDFIYCNVEIDNEHAIHIYSKLGKIKDVGDYYQVVFYDKNGEVE